MKKSMQWDVFGVFGLILGMGVVISVFGHYLPIQFYDTASDVILWVVLSGLAFVFGFMGFVFGYLEAKKEYNPSSREYNPSRRDSVL